MTVFPQKYQIAQFLNYSHKTSHNNVKRVPNSFSVVTLLVKFKGQGQIAKMYLKLTIIHLAADRLIINLERRDKK